MCFSKQGVSRRAKIKDELINIELELLKSHNDEQTHDKNLAIDRIKSDFSSMQRNFPRQVLRLAPFKIHMEI